MSEMLSSQWHQIVITDEGGLSGASVAKFMTPIVRKIDVTAVVVADVLGASPGLLGYEKQLLSADDFLRRVENATQYDWAFFFLYSNSPCRDLLNSDDKNLILNADATVRLADDYYFYVYTRNGTIASELCRRYPAAEYKLTEFAKLDVPY